MLYACERHIRITQTATSCPKKGSICLEANIGGRGGGGHGGFCTDFGDEPLSFVMSMISKGWGGEQWLGVKGKG